MKVCSRCHKTLPDCDFQENGTTYLQCNSCREKRRKYREKCRKSSALTKPVNIVPKKKSKVCNEKAIDFFIESIIQKQATLTFCGLCLEEDQVPHYTLIRVTGDFNPFNIILKNDLKTLILTNQYTDKRRRVKYEKSLYRFIERRDTTLVNNFPYILYAGSSEHESAFYRWIDRYVYTLDIPLGSTDNFLVYQMFSNEFVTSIRVNGPTESKHAELIQKYVRKEEITINDIPLNLNEELINLNGSIEVFFYTPIILYIIKEVVNSAIHTENK